MQALIDKYGINVSYLVYAAAAVAVLIVLWIVLRFAFGRRIRSTGGGRARQPRMGVVDAFDLDRQRQLVLVRRDNVEHLIMIGGPNDVLVESSIVRAGLSVDARPRQNVASDENVFALGQPPTLPAMPTAATVPPAPAAPIVAPITVRAAAAPPPPPSPFASPPPPPVRVAIAAPPAPPAMSPLPEPVAPPPAAAMPAPTAPQPAAPPPPKPAFEFPRFTTRSLDRKPEPQTAAEIEPRPVAEAVKAAIEPVMFGVEAPKPSVEPFKPLVEAPKPPHGLATPGAVAETSVSSAKPAPAKILDPLEALEEEMAKLLGRPSGSGATKQ